ncbi:hypothetical protein [Williamsia sp.]|nr:hypothetical protein [Williamsia sp.]
MTLTARFVRDGQRRTLAALLSRSLWPTIIAHTAYDTAVLVL